MKKFLKEKVKEILENQNIVCSTIDWFVFSSRSGTLLPVFVDQQLEPSFLIRIAGNKIFGNQLENAYKVLKTLDCIKLGAPKVFTFSYYNEVAVSIEEYINIESAVEFLVNSTDKEKEIFLNDVLKWSVNLSSAGKETEIVQHGDFSPFNIKYCKKTREIYVYDWEYAKFKSSYLDDLFNFYLVYYCLSKRLNSSFKKTSLRNFSVMPSFEDFSDLFYGEGVISKAMRINVESYCDSFNLDKADLAFLLKEFVCSHYVFKDRAVELIKQKGFGV